MTILMAGLTTSMGLTFSLDWKEKKSEGEGELDREGVSEKKIRKGE